MRKAKFKIGEKVRVVKYGALCWINEPGQTKPAWYDLMPELVGKEAFVTDRIKTQSKYFYELNELTKTSWYNERQLEKVLPAQEDKKSWWNNIFKKKDDRDRSGVIP